MFQLSEQTDDIGAEIDIDVDAASPEFGLDRNFSSLEARELSEL